MNDDDAEEPVFVPASEIAITASRMAVAPGDIIDLACNNLVVTEVLHITKDGQAFTFSDDGLGTIHAVSDLWRQWTDCPDRNRIAGWQSGTFQFQARKALGGSNEWKLFGVGFDIAAIEKFIPGFGRKWAGTFGARYGLAPAEIPDKSGEALNSSQLARPQNPGGAPRETDKWDAVFIALLRLAMDGRLDRGTEGFVKTQAKLRRSILDDDDCTRLDVKDETIKPFIRKVWYSVIEPGGFL